ncbi:hypothetical protein PQ472_01230 [Lacticaseibacillus pabuli]|uniref:Uncharacterized protein n=1 Tax=Lacticaseibacillus pabuli TaxID=3025672 RepID=A0ABY7WSX3_9LACO|nr:hypothetical protein [Lacticaseibacillus sp. KACC 23028]WDF82894.1 hypothetical protein PQ472_01230 [Lacticaseibacillus sp. KACC 23028]
MKKSLVVIAMLSATLATGAVVTAAPTTSAQPVAAATTVSTAKSELNKILANAEAIKPNAMSHASYEGLQRAIGLAKMTTTNKASDNVDYNFAIAVLHGFMDLGNTSANHFALTYMVASAQSVQAKDYTAVSYNKFNKVYQVAMGVNSNKNATQQQLDAQTNALNQALEQLDYTSPAPITGVATVHYAKGYGIQIWNGYKEGRGIVKTSKGKAKKLMSGSKWKVFAVANYAGHTYYSLGGNQWIDGKYVSVK